MAKRKRRPSAGYLHQRPDGPSELIKKLVDLANATAEHFDGSLDTVLAIIAQAPLAFGAWQDDTEPHGVGLLLLKGEDLLRDVVATDTMACHHTAAIRCVQMEQAIMLQEILRERHGTDPGETAQGALLSRTA